MPRSWPGYAAPLVASVATLLLVWIQELLMGRAVAQGESISLDLVLVILLSLAIPLGLPAVWGGAVLLGRPATAGVLAAILCLAASFGIAGQLLFWSTVGYVLAGVACGWSLARRWRLDAALILVTLALAPVFLVSLQEVSPRDSYDQMIAQYLEARREMLAGTADDREIERTLEAERRQQEEIAEQALKIVPAAFGLGALGYSGLLLVLTWLVSRLLRLKVGLIKWPPFGRWRLPFYLVWILVFGLGLFITRISGLTTVGLNLALAVGTLFSIQGAAVQWTMTGKFMGPLPRVLYLLVAGFLFFPLVVLGLADQWRDFRKLDHPSDEDDPQDRQGAGRAPDDEAD